MWNIEHMERERHLMIETLIGALLPVVFTVLFGYLSGSIGSFKKDFPSKLNKLVMSYALPLSLFFSINQMNRELIFKNWNIAIWQFCGMIFWWLVVYLFSRYVLHSGPIVSPIRAMAISTPAILFVGPALLLPLYQKTGTIAVSIGGVMMNVVMLPLTAIVLSVNDKREDGHRHLSVFQTLWSGLKKPVVFSALLGLLTSLIGMHLPAIFSATFNELGKAAAGGGLFSIGLILYFNKPSFSKAVWGNVFMTEVVVPLSLFAALVISGQAKQFVDQTTLTFMISQMIFPSIFAQQYGEGQREMASSIFLTTILSFFVIAIYMTVRGVML